VDKDALETRLKQRKIAAVAKEAHMDLNGKRVVILGGTSGIGLAVAQAAAGEGAQVVVASSNAERLAQALSVLPASAEGRVANLLNGGEVTALFKDVGAFDHLVYTAGESLQIAPLKTMDIATARSFFELRYWGALTAAKAAQATLRPGGSIVFTSGVAGARPGSGWSVASSICSAMEGLTRALAVELAPIRVNIVSPGVVRTALWREMDEEAREGLYASEAARLPVGHVAEASEIAEGYLYLMRQTYATGQVLAVEGGGLLV
jgi:NAD(P)-dependent dehydrogenase (short-subunit alcohol dehydrogenase family)